MKNIHKYLIRVFIVPSTGNGAFGKPHILMELIMYRKILFGIKELNYNKNILT
jgi:hypothetical protein